MWDCPSALFLDYLDAAPLPIHPMLLCSYQALWLGKILTGEIQLPSVLEMQEDILLQQRCG